MDGVEDVELRFALSNERQAMILESIFRLQRIVKVLTDVIGQTKTYLKQIELQQQLLEFTLQENIEAADAAFDEIKFVIDTLQNAYDSDLDSQINRENLKSLKNQLLNYHRRKNKLEERRALLGLSTPPEVEISIEDIEQTISSLRDQIEFLNEV